MFTNFCNTKHMHGNFEGKPLKASNSRLYFLKNPDWLNQSNICKQNLVIINILVYLIGP